MRKKVSIVLLVSAGFFLSWAVFKNEPAYHEKELLLANQQVAYFYDDLDDTGWENISIADVPELSSAILRALATTNNQPTDIITYINQIAELTEMGYWFEVPAGAYLFTSTIPTPDFYNANFEYDAAKSDGFLPYCHALFQNKSARKILSEGLSNWLVRKCSEQPIDFKYRVLEELEFLMTDVATFADYDMTTYPNDEMNDYYTGFLFRRYKSDQVPLEEISDGLYQLRSRIAAIPDATLPLAYYAYHINNHLDFCITADECYIVSVKSGRKFNFTLNDGECPILVQCTNDATGSYYTFRTSDEGGQVWLFDEDANIIE